MTFAVQVRDGTAQPNNFDASVINSLFPTPLLDMRALNAHACNSSLSLADRVQALEVPPPHAHGDSHTFPVTLGVCRSSKSWFRNATMRAACRAWTASLA